MALKPQKTVNDKTENNIHKARRGFLKKSAYAAPTLIVLGGLLKPTKAKADFGPPPSDPDTGTWN